MIEVVFSESAYGSLQVGQSYGTGKYNSGATSVFIRKKDGSKPTEEELREAQMQAEEKARRDWENAVPLGSQPKDIFCFDVAFSVGEITETGFGKQRRDALELLASVWPMEDIISQIDDRLKRNQEALDSVLARCADGESVRVWYSHNPDEMCGMYWLLSQLRPLKQRGRILLVKLPEWEYKDEMTICTHNGWGEIGPGEWGRYQSIQQEAQPAFLALCSTKWSQLKEENARLRIFLNGQLQSAPEDVYDSFITREIDKQPEAFVEAMVIGNVLGKYQLGIGDAWIALRMEKMIAEGRLEVIDSAPAGALIYRQKLRKVICDSEGNVLYGKQFG